jgi:hypothetical protein
MNTQRSHLEFENNITWLEEPLNYPYLRESYELIPLRSRFPLKRFSKPLRIKLIGYSHISALAKAETGGFHRRVWFLKFPNDPSVKGSSFEAVKPSSIEIAHESELGREEPRAYGAGQKREHR